MPNITNMLQKCPGVGERRREKLVLAHFPVSKEREGWIGGGEMGCDVSLCGNRTLTLIGEEDKVVFSFQNNTRSKEHSKALIHTADRRQDRHGQEEYREASGRENRRRYTQRYRRGYQRMRSVLMVNRDVESTHNQSNRDTRPAGKRLSMIELNIDGVKDEMNNDEHDMMLSIVKATQHPPQTLLVNKQEVGMGPTLYDATEFSLNNWTKIATSGGSVDIF